MSAIEACRTAALGGYVARCENAELMPQGIHVANVPIDKATFANTRARARLMVIPTA
jgi:hypothetical protein